MIVVSDTSPVLNLARIGQAHLLCLLYREILVPGVVAEELTRNGTDPRSINCLLVREPANKEAVLRLQSELDSGESAAIVLALEVGADVVLADERKGRKKESHGNGSGGCRITRRYQRGKTEGADSGVQASA